MSTLFREIEGIVSVTPLSLDLTSRVSLDAANACLGVQLASSEDMSWLSPYLPSRGARQHDADKLSLDIPWMSRESFTFSP